MIKNQLFTLLFLFSLFAIGCKNEAKETSAKLHSEIMEEHNKVMPKMAELNRLKRQLKTYKDVVSDDNVALKDSLINAILVLSKSEDLMNDWMAHYKYPNPDKTAEAMVKYLAGQKDSIKQVGDDMYMSIAIGNGLMNQAPDSLKSPNYNIKPKAHLNN